MVVNYRQSHRYSAGLAAVRWYRNLALAAGLGTPDFGPLGFAAVVAVVDAEAVVADCPAMMQSATGQR